MTAGPVPKEISRSIARRRTSAGGERDELTATTAKGASNFTFDLVLIALLISAAVAGYSRGLGFYSDDWAFLTIAGTAKDGSLGAVYHALEGADRTLRPIQFLGFALEYTVFGSRPAGYHAVLGTLVVLGAVLFYAVLRRMGVGRTLALASALAFGFSPNASTARLWPAVPAYLSVVFFLGSVLASLAVGTGSRRRAAGYCFIALAAQCLSALTYEIALPLFLLTAALTLRRNAAARLLAAATMATTIFFAFAKFSLNTRHGHVPQFAGRLGSISNDLANAVAVNFGEFVLGLPVNALALRPWLHDFDFAVTLIAGVAATGAVSVAALGAGIGSRRDAVLVAAFGVVVCGLGYAVFVPNSFAGYSAMGVWNRTALASSLGIALLVAGLAALFASLFPKGRARSICCAVLVGLYCCSGSAVVSANAAAWREATRLQGIAGARVAARLGARAAGRSQTFILLGGICPYAGSGIVMESRYDATGILRAAFGSASLGADVVSGTTRIADGKLQTTFYIEQTAYPIAAGMLGYDFVSQRASRLDEPGRARRFVAQAQDELRRCPAGVVGYGASMFPMERRRVGF